MAFTPAFSRTFSSAHAIAFGVHGLPSRLRSSGPELVEMLKGLAEHHGSGPLLLNRLGKPWTPKAIAWALLKVREKAGVKAIAYGYRHTFATDGLANGLPETHVAGLLGHGSTAMLHKHYSHLTAKAGVLRNAAALVRPAARPDALTAVQPPAAITA